MTAQPLVLPRRLAIQLMAEAQQAGDRAVGGVVAARGNVPVAVYPAGAADATLPALRDGETLWAVYRSHPAAGWEPSAADLSGAGPADVLHLIVSVDTKGVLQLRGWRIRNGNAVQQELRIGE